MKKLYQLFLSSVTFLFLSSQVKIAYADICPPGQFKALCGFTPDKLEGAVGNIVSVLIIIAVALALLYLIYGGIKWITSGGDKGKVEAARSHIVAAIVGLIISLLAYFILNIITYIITGNSITGFQIPTLF